MDSADTDNEIFITVHDPQKVVLWTNQDKPGQSPVKDKTDLTDLRRDTIEVLKDLLKEKRQAKTKELDVLGKNLFDALLFGAVRNKFEERYREFYGKNGRQLRIRLSFEEGAGKLASYPWEYLYWPRRRNDGHVGGFFLSTKISLVLSRFIEKPGLGSLMPERGVLRLLIVCSDVAETEGLDRVEAQDVVTTIETVADALAARNKGEKVIDWEKLDPPATVKNLKAAMNSKTPHVLHFIGHGRFNEKTKHAEIALQNEQGHVSWREDALFVDYVTELENNALPPRLVFLQMCEGATVDFEESFAGMAPKLILRGVEAVVAMQHSIEQGHAIEFSKAFYEALGRGMPIDQAVQSSRVEMLEASDKRVFGTPVLYMQSANGAILPKIDVLAGQGMGTGKGIGTGRGGSIARTGAAEGGPTPPSDQSPSTDKISPTVTEAGAAQPLRQLESQTSPPAGQREQAGATAADLVLRPGIGLLSADVRSAAYRACAQSKEISLAEVEPEIDSLLSLGSSEAVQQAIKDRLDNDPPPSPALYSVLIAMKMALKKNA